MAKQTRPAKKAAGKAPRARQEPAQPRINPVEEVMRKAALKAMSEGISDQDEIRERIAAARREFIGKD